MFNQIEEAIEWVTSRRNRNTGFEHFQCVMKSLGNPQDSFCSIHLAGTNGKGSTANYIADVLEALGFKIGLYTSPHLVNHRDRIRINHQWIPENRFLELLNRYQECIETEDLSMFEIDTLISSVYFKEEQVDYAVIETGLGGRLDSTNVLNHPKLEIITTIGYDHMDRLGNTLSEIATEKAGILKPNSTVLLGNLGKEADLVLTQRAEELSCRLVRVKPYRVRSNQVIEMDSTAYTLSTVADYQKEDAVLALCALELLGVDIHQESVIQAMQKSSWAGRFETVCKNPTVILDGAHNVEGITALCASMEHLQRPIVVVYSALKDKQTNEMYTRLHKNADLVITTQFDNPRAGSAEYLSEGHGIVIEDYRKAFLEGEKQVNSQGTLIIAGSLYFISLAREFHWGKIEVEI